VRLQADGAVAIRDDCNWRTGTYDAARGLKFSPLLGSPSPCPAPSLGGLFVEFLAQAKSFVTDGQGLLTVSLQRGGYLTLEPVSEIDS
jgi:hypothetical protein